MRIAGSLVGILILGERYAVLVGAIPSQADAATQHQSPDYTPRKPHSKHWPAALAVTADPLRARSGGRKGSISLPAHTIRPKPQQHLASGFVMAGESSGVLYCRMDIPKIAFQRVLPVEGIGAGSMED